MADEEFVPLTLENEATEVFRKTGHKSSSDSAVTQKKKLIFKCNQQDAT